MPLHSILAFIIKADSGIKRDFNLRSSLAYSQRSGMDCIVHEVLFVLDVPSCLLDIHSNIYLKNKPPI
jgi:hypothetical protein